MARPPEIDSGWEVTVPRRRAAGGLEEQVLAVLGAADGPLGPRDVQERLGGGGRPGGVLAYFVADLSPDDAAALSELLAAGRTDGRA